VRIGDLRAARDGLSVPVCSASADSLDRSRQIPPSDVRLDRSVPIQPTVGRGRPFGEGRRCSVARARIVVVAWLSGALLVTPAAARAEDWTQFHAGRTCAGVVSGETLLTTTTAASIHKLWGAATDPSSQGINSSPAVERRRG
jgi:hypothetical protein